MVDAPVDRVWARVRRDELAGESWTRYSAVRRMAWGLLGLRRWRATRVDDLCSTPAEPGFQILLDDPPRAFVVGAIRRFGASQPFVHVTGAGAWRGFAAPGHGRIAWGLHLDPAGGGTTRVRLEWRADAVDAEGWARFEQALRREARILKSALRFLLRALHREFAPPSRPESPRLPSP